MKKLLPLLMVVLLIVAMAVPAFATDRSLFYWYGNLMLPEINEDYQYNFIYTGTDNITRHVTFEKMETETRQGFHIYNFIIYQTDGLDWTVRLQDGGHYYFQATQMVGNSPVWSDFDYKNSFVDNPTFVAIEPLLAVCDGSSCPSTDVNKDNICDDCGLEFAVLRDYSPFTVKKFMNHIGQIFTSAASWVSDVGAAILADPLLLAFTALPLCGLGIAVFRRLKNTV